MVEQYQPPLSLSQSKGGKVSGIDVVSVSTPSESPPILGEKGKARAFIHVFIRTCGRCEDARSGRASLPKIGEGSGGVDIEERLFAGPSAIGG